MAVQPWDRQRLLLLFGAVAATGMLLVTGLGFAVGYALADPAPAPSAVAGPAERPGRAGNVRDAIAAAPMLVVGRSAAFTPDASTVQAGVIEVPVATVTWVRRMCRRASRAPLRGRWGSWRRSRRRCWKR